MKPISFSYAHSCLLSPDEIATVCEQLEPERIRSKNALSKEYATDYASLYLPSDKALHDRVNKMVAEKQKLKPTVLVVLGIGGSNLGTLAVYQALAGIWANNIPGAIKVYYADTIAPDYTAQLLSVVEQELVAGNTVILNIVSKSGTTTETVINFELFLDLLKKYRPKDYASCVVVTTDQGSKLWNLAERHNFSCLAVPKLVGGRYSVLSAVGLFPLALLGIDISSLCAGAQDMRDSCLIGPQSVAAISAAIALLQYNDGHIINDFFVFPAELAGMGQWYRQLMGESLGKQHDVQGQDVFVGPTPTVSVGSTDLHSVGQLYLGGPYDKYTTFLSVESYHSTVKIGNAIAVNELVPDLQGKSVAQVVRAIEQGVQLAYTTSQRPFSSIVLPQKNAYYCGQLLQWKMLEIIYMGALLEVNPFDQPQVELYKQETRKILAHE